MVSHSSLVSFFCMWRSSFPITIYWRGFSFSIVMCLAPWSKISCPYTCGFISGLSILFHWAVWLFSAHIILFWLLQLCSRKHLFLFNVFIFNISLGKDLKMIELKHYFIKLKYKWSISLSALDSPWHLCVISQPSFFFFWLPLELVVLKNRGWGKSRFTVMSTCTQSLYLIISYCIIFHMNNCKPTFAPPCTLKVLLFCIRCKFTFNLVL